MVVVIIPKELKKEKDLIAVPHRAYEEFLAWQKKVKSAKIYNPTAAEKRMIARARRNFAKGNYEVISKPSFWMKFLNLSRIEAKILKHSVYSVEESLQRCRPNSGISDEYGVLR